MYTLKKFHVPKKKLSNIYPRETSLEIGQLKYDESTTKKRLHAMNFIKNLDKWIPHKLREDSKIRSLTIANFLLARDANGPFIDRVVTCDNSAMG